MALRKDNINSRSGVRGEGISWLTSAINFHKLLKQLLSLIVDGMDAKHILHHIT